MLEEDMLEQLKSVFSKLQSEIDLVYFDSTHEKQQELVEMLTEISSVNALIQVKKTNEKCAIPSFIIVCKGKPTGIKFSGIPGGHEFSSLVIAILNADNKGKFPDEMILNRIRNLKGPIHLKTYISLSCENCPDVVQSLNMMALIHGNFTHEMIDGEFAQEEIALLKLHGVPSVVHNQKLIASGKMSLLDILEKLESYFGIENTHKLENTELGIYDVVVIGAGPAGAAAAIYTARKGLKVAVIADRVGGQMLETRGIENFISVPYTEGPILSAELGKHMAKYEIQIFENRRVASIQNQEMKHLVLNSGESLQAKALIVCTGAKWRELNVVGEKDYLGRGVAFCPHCDGPFYKGKDIAVIGGGNSGIEAAIDLAGIVKSVVVLEFAPELKADAVLVKKLESLSNVSIIKHAQTNKVLGNDEKVTGLEYIDRTSQQVKTIALDGIFVQIGLVPNSHFLSGIVERTKFGEIIIDSKCKTSAAGIYAAGDVTIVPYKQIVIAMGEGAKAGLAAFEELMLS